MTTRKMSRSAIVLFACLLGGCAADDGPRDACELITAEELTAITGVTLVPKPEPHGDTASTCTYWDEATNIDWFAVQVAWQGGRTEWQQWNAATKGAARMIEHEEPDVDVADIVSIGPVAGLGDRARYSGLLGGFVLKDDTLLWFKFGMLPKPERHFRPLALKALEKL